MQSRWENRVGRIGTLMGTTALGINAIFSFLEFFKKQGSEGKLNAGQLARDARNLLLNLTGFFM